MPTNEFPTDRFDAVPRDVARVGAHRAEQPRLRGGVVVLWAAVATIVLFAAGVFGIIKLMDSGVTFPGTQATATQAPGKIDTKLTVLVLNASPNPGAAAQMKQRIIGAGWSEASVLTSDANETNFKQTTVYFVNPKDESAARGLAQVLGVSHIARQEKTGATASSSADGLTVVIGADFANKTAGTPTPTK